MTDKDRLEFEFNFPIPALLNHVSYDAKTNLYYAKNDYVQAQESVNLGWQLWLIQQKKIESKDKLLIQQGQAYNEQSQKVKDLEYQLGLDFKLVNPDAVLVLARVNFCKFHSAEQMRKEMDHLHKAFKKAGKQVIVFDSGYSLEVMTDEQLSDVGLKRINRTNAPKATRVKSSTITVTLSDIDKTDSTSSEGDELRQRINKAIVRGTSKLVVK